MLLNANSNKIIPKTTIMQQKNPSLNIIRGMKQGTDAIKNLMKSSLFNMLQNNVKNPITWRTETARETIKNQDLVKKLVHYPQNFITLFEKNQKYITIDALDTIIRGYTTYILMQRYPEKIRELLIAYTYSSGQLNNNLKTVASFIALPQIKEKIKNISGFSALLPKNSLIPPQLLEELKTLKASEFPKYDEALTTIEINKSIVFPLIFLNDAWRELFNVSSLMKRDNTRNVNWDTMFVRVEKIQSVAGTFYCIREFLPMDIKNTSLGMCPKDNIYRNSEQELRENFPQFQTTLIRDIALKLKRENISLYTKTNLLALRNKLLLNQKNIENPETFSTAISTWNNLQQENLTLITQQQLPFNLLSYTENKNIKTILPDDLWDLYNNTYDQITGNGIITNLILTARYKNIMQDSRTLTQIYDNIGHTLFEKNCIIYSKYGSVIKNGQSTQIKEILDTLIQKTKNNDISI